MEGTRARGMIVHALGHGDFLEEMRRSVREGMALAQKSIPCKYLYDARGTRLFACICSLPEYYPTRTELGILDANAGRIMEFFRSVPGDLVDLGSGSDLKARKLLGSLPPSRAARVRYVPVDISAEGLDMSFQNLERDFPGLELLGIVGDFTAGLDYLPGRRKLVCFLGGTFGNFSPEQGTELLSSLARAMGPEDAVLLGLDMLKPSDVIEAAYNDRAGVTARFNLNTLRHVNEKLGANFDLDRFSHLAFFDPDRSHVEMHLRARCPMEVCIADLGMTVSLAEGETIRTEISRKFSREEACGIIGRAGLGVSDWYTDERGWFSLAVLKPRSGACR